MYIYHYDHLNYKCFDDTKIYVISFEGNSQPRHDST